GSGRAGCLPPFVAGAALPPGRVRAARPGGLRASARLDRWHRRPARLLPPDRPARGLQPAECADAALDARRPGSAIRPGDGRGAGRGGCRHLPAWRTRLKARKPMPRPSRRADPTAWSPYGRHTDRAPGSTLPADQHGSARNGAAQDDQYDGATYYDRPVVKRSHYGWLIASYLFIGGLAGAAQIIATLADLLGGRRDRGVVRAGRYVALTGAL